MKKKLAQTWFSNEIFTVETPMNTQNDHIYATLAQVQFWQNG